MFESIFYFLKNTPDLVFWVSAFFGTILFFLRLCTIIIGGMSGELGEEQEFDFDESYHTSSFKLLTMHTLSGFFMMFGWTGLACIRQFNCRPLGAILYAACVGVITIILTALIFKWAQRLVSFGEQFSVEKTINRVGVVYQRISGNEPGKIHVIVNDMTREILARSFDGTTIESFQVVRIVRVLDYETVIVQKIVLHE